MRKIWKICYRVDDVEAIVFIETSKVLRESLDIIIALEAEFIVSPVDVCESLKEVNSKFSEDSHDTQ